MNASEPEVVEANSTVHIVRTGVANLASVIAAVERIGARPVLIERAEEVAQAPAGGPRQVEEACAAAGHAYPGRWVWPRRSLWKVGAPDRLKYPTAAGGRPCLNPHRRARARPRLATAS